MDNFRQSLAATLREIEGIDAFIIESGGSHASAGRITAFNHGPHARDQ